MKTPCYGLVALTLVALTIFAPTTVAHAQAYSALYDFEPALETQQTPRGPALWHRAVMATCIAAQQTVEGRAQCSRSHPVEL
jgi:hypothetical protein